LAVWEAWVKKSKTFMNYAEKDLQEGRFDSSAFFAQQSAELLLKAILLKRTGARPYTHSLTELLELIAQVFSAEIPDDVRVCAHILERHYIASRYPDAGIGEYDKSDAQEALRCLKRLMDYVRGLGEDI
jgi:HEPN domain-containing protein